MRLALTALVSAAVGAVLALWLSKPVPLATRVKLSTERAVILRKQAMVDCMAYTAAKVIGLEPARRSTDEACESLAQDFSSTLEPKAPEPAPKPTAAGEYSL